MTCKMFACGVIFHTPPRNNMATPLLPPLDMEYSQWFGAICPNECRDVECTA